jgi:NADH-quinone oxidoreductase subunit J
LEIVYNLFFTLVVLLTVIPAVMVVLTVNIVRAACWLLISLGGAALLFFFLGADFVGATQLLIYVGGTLVLVIFGVMLTATGPFVKLASRGGDWVLSIAVGLPLFGLLAYGLTQRDWQGIAVQRIPAEKVSIARVTTQQIGMSLLGLHQHTDVLDVKAIKETAPAAGHGHPAGEQPVEHAHEGEQAAAHPHDHGAASHEHARARSFHGMPTVQKRSSTYLLPFEIVSVHLVVVLIGAAYLARAKRRRDLSEAA